MEVIQTVSCVLLHVPGQSLDRKCSLVKHLMIYDSFAGEHKSLIRDDL